MYYSSVTLKMTSRNTEFVSQLFMHYGVQLHNYLNSRINRHDVEDIAQKTYLQILQHPNPEEIQNPQAYLFRTASNLAIDSIRRDNTRSKHTTVEIDTDEVSSAAPGMDTIIDSKLKFREFLSALDELPEMCRHAFILNRLDGLTHSEIAAQLGVSKKTVQRYILKALKHCEHRLSL